VRRLAEPARALAMLPRETRERNTMPKHPFTKADLAVLEQWDTPTICNGLEIIVPERRAIGFTV